MQVVVRLGTEDFVGTWWTAKLGQDDIIKALPDYPMPPATSTVTIMKQIPDAGAHPTLLLESYRWIY